METLLLASAVIDCAAVAGMGWLLRRTGHARTTALAAERAILERLRVDLVQLVSEAGHQARALEESLGAREARLRALMAETSAPPRLRIDAAEARLLRDLALAECDPHGLARRVGEGLKTPDVRADRPAGKWHEATVRGLSHEDR
jgi:hypothetical protein